MTTTINLKMNKEERGFNNQVLKSYSYQLFKDFDGQISELLKSNSNNPEDAMVIVRLLIKDPEKKDKLIKRIHSNFDCNIDETCKEFKEMLEIKSKGGLIVFKFESPRQY